MSASATLPTLLWTVLEGLERAYADAGAESLRPPWLDLWANLLRVVTETGTDCRQLPAMLRLSKRAVRSRVATAVRHGWVEELKFGRGQATVRLTALGSDVAARWRLLQRAGEERWRAKVGADQASQLRAILEKIVARLPLEHSHYPASYGAADASITGGNGEDWNAVLRKGRDTVSDLPLSALISQVLVAFAMSYEEKAPVAFSLSTTVIKRIPVEGRPLRELSNPVGVAALVRHGFLRVSGNHGIETAYLTARGRAVSDAYEEQIQAVEAEWRNRLGNESVTALRRALENLTETNGFSKTCNPNVAFCRRPR